jgi:hypothetical protein
MKQLANDYLILRRLQSKMVQCAAEHGLCHPRTVRLSRSVDKRIVSIMRRQLDANNSWHQRIICHWRKERFKVD